MCERICQYCANWLAMVDDSQVMHLCREDMFEDECEYWFVKVEAMHECHRPRDFKEAR